MKPAIKPTDWINIGPPKFPSGPSAVVCQVYPEGHESDCEVVYMSGGKAINEDVRWDGEYWEFTIKGPCGGYADRYDRLQEYVRILRSGRPQ